MSDDYLFANANRVGVVEETLGDEMLKLNKMLKLNNMVVAPADDDMGMPWVVNHPISAANVPQVGPKRAPDVGEHSRQILQSLGYDDAQIDDLLARGVV
jgi:formyl-CoA transferase